MTGPAKKNALTEEDRALTLKASRHRKDDGSINISAGALEVGISRAAFRTRLVTMKDEVEKKEKSGLSFPDFPDDDVPIEEVIDLQAKRFEKRRASYEAHTWYKVKINEPGPIGILWFGDPHCDDNSCNWPLLREHASICKETPHLYGANIGDVNNSWAGRLAALYAKQDTSVKTARRFAKWFMLEAGISWLIWLMGNHDLWGAESDILRLIGGNQILMHDWEARFRIAWPDGEEIRVSCSHDFPGNSQWNPGHGPMKEAQMGQEADLYVCGHKHHWFGASWEVAKRGGGVATIVRVRGYKFDDDYARNLGIREQESGASCLTILRPYAKDKSERVQKIFDIEYGARILKMERKNFERRK